MSAAIPLAGAVSAISAIWNPIVAPLHAFTLPARNVAAQLSSYVADVTLPARAVTVILINRIVDVILPPRTVDFEVK
jgi:hypothetical protein